MEMKNNLSFLVFFVLFLCSSLNSNLCFGGDTISANKSLSFGQTIVSSGGFFELGFFRPGNSSKYYIGIWYKNIALQTVVWVANREKPLDYGAANLTIIQGNLVLLDRFQGVVWSTHSAKSVTPNNSVIAVLHDDGNLILSDFSDSSTPLILWQSFDYPTDTFLPGAKLGYDKRTQKKQVLVSWKNLNDPTPGLFSLELLLKKLISHLGKPHSVDLLVSPIALALLILMMVPLPDLIGKRWIQLLSISHCLHFPQVLTVYLLPKMRQFHNLFYDGGVRVRDWNADLDATYRMIKNSYSTNNRISFPYRQALHCSSRDAEHFVTTVFFFLEQQQVGFSRRVCSVKGFEKWVIDYDSPFFANTP